MSSMSKVDQHECVCHEIHELYIRKNHDYGDSFSKTFAEEGFAMARIRLSDKLERFKTLSKKADQKVMDESIRDTLMDLANYAMMTIVEMDMRNDDVHYLPDKDKAIQELKDKMREIDRDVSIKNVYNAYTPTSKGYGGCADTGRCYK